MKHIIEKRILSAHELRGLCIVHDWCDCMTNDLYHEIFRPLDEIEAGNQQTLSVADIQYIAERIMAGTSYDNLDGYELTDIMFAIGERAHTIFEYVEV